MSSTLDRVAAYLESTQPGQWTMNNTKLPGSPAFACARRRLVIFVNECPTHRHQCRTWKMPKENRKLWKENTARNLETDLTIGERYRHRGWSKATTWDCLWPAKRWEPGRMNTWPTTHLFSAEEKRLQTLFYRRKLVKPDEAIWSDARRRTCHIAHDGTRFLRCAAGSHMAPESDFGIKRESLNGRRSNCRRCDSDAAVERATEHKRKRKMEKLAMTVGSACVPW